MVEVGERAAEPGQVGGDHLLGHVPQPGVDQQRALVPEQEVLADVALAEVALDAVDAGGHLHAAGSYAAGRGLG